jgi:hypothetical protein
MNKYDFMRINLDLKNKRKQASKSILIYLTEVGFPHKTSIILKPPIFNRWTKNTHVSHLSSIQDITSDVLNR